MASETSSRDAVETGDGGRLVAEHQAALRRVATVVLEGATAAELFALVVAEVVAALEVPAAWLFRSEPDRSLTVLAASNDTAFPVGSRWPDGDADVGAQLTEAMAATTREPG